jgi:hypothetical protein
MKSLKILSIIALAIFSITLISCNKDDNQDEPNLTSGLTGTYTGTLTTNGLKGTSPATVDITAVNNYTIQVHCYGDDIDTTIMLELYEDGNMMRVCFTDDDFYNEYGHNQSENHHMMGGNDGCCTNWSQHMNNDHQPNDKHYGYFNLDNHQFDYTFNVKTPSATYTQQFVGTIQ